MNLSLDGDPIPVNNSTMFSILPYSEGSLMFEITLSYYLQHFSYARQIFPFFLTFSMIISLVYVSIIFSLLSLALITFHSPDMQDLFTATFFKKGVISPDFKEGVIIFNNKPLVV